jgi:hypothetical protein
MTVFGAQEQQLLWETNMNLPATKKMRIASNYHGRLRDALQKQIDECGTCESCYAARELLAELAKEEGQ